MQDTPTPGFFFQDRALQVTQAVSEPTALLVFGLALLVIGGGLRRKRLEAEPKAEKTPELQPIAYPAVQLAEVPPMSAPIPR